MMMGKKPRILLAFPSRFYYPKSSERVEIKTSLLLLASYLAPYFPVEYADFEITIGRPNSELQIKRYKRKVREFLSNYNFDILGISCWTSLSYQATLTTARICRELFPDRLIVVGGYHPTARPDEFITDDNVIDYVVRGEGELAFKEIAEGFNSSKRPGKTTIVNAPAFTQEHFVDYNWSLVDPFIKSNFSGQLKNAYIVLSRGCPYNCSFCMEPMKDHKWRAYTPEQSINEIRKVVENYRPRAIPISDACFGLRRSWRKEFLKRLVEIEPDFLVILETRAEYLDIEDIKLLSNLNVEVQFGIESCSPEILLLMRKTRQPEKYLDKFREISHQMSDYGVVHRASLIFNHPGETRKTLDETFSFIDTEISRQNTYLIWANHGYMHFPGCALDINKEFYENKYGSKFLSDHWWTENEDQYESSLRFIPSSDLDGDKRLLWQKMIDQRFEQFKSALTDKAFRYAAGKYFPEWKNDPRFKQI
jgi:radical SAM superfamily enzyme YgiQ (UPF0313 family)